MPRSRFVLVGMSAIGLLWNGTGKPEVSNLAHILVSRQSEALSAGSSTSIGSAFAFSAQQTAESTEATSESIAISAPYNTESWDEGDPAQERFDLPLLYLHREREPALEHERTLHIHIAGLAAAAEVQIEAVSRHVDYLTLERFTTSQHFRLPDHPCTFATPCTVSWMFDAASTYSGFYDLRVIDAGGAVVWEQTVPDRPAFVVLDTWDVGLGEYSVRVIYATLFAFAKATNQVVNKLPPDAVTDFIEHQFVPAIANTWNTQFGTWGFGNPIHPQWDADKVVEIIITDPPFALFGGTGTYHISHRNRAPHPQRRLWWRATNNSFQPYNSLADAYRAVFAHEFFHLVQLNAMLSAGCSGNRWMNVFIEAQGKFAPSVMYPEMELLQPHTANGKTVESEYANAANRFLALRLNTSYTDLEAAAIDKYDAALYWRFLYEQFGDIGIVRAALEEMACSQTPDIVAGMGEVMDRTFQRFDGPYRTFEESLIGFARANYALRLENSRCEAANPTECAGLYHDPNGMYVDPPLEAELTFSGIPLAHAGAIPASFGIDLIDVDLEAAADGQPITIRFQAEGGVARFNVEIWKLKSGDGKPRAVTAQPETMRRSQDGAYAYTVSAADAVTVDRLALIITRLDVDEAADPVGSFHITMKAESNAES